MKIECLITFLDGSVRFEKNDICTVPDEDGARFCTAGWARDVSGETATGDPSSSSVDLDIQNAASDHSSNNLGA